MAIRTQQTFLFLALSSALGALAFFTLDAHDELWFYPVVITRVLGSLLFLLSGVFTLSRKALPRATGCVALLAVAVVESALCFLQGGSFGPSYAVVCVSLVLSSACSDLDLASAFLAFLPSQALILAAPLLALPIATWFNLIHTIAALILPCLTLTCSAILWTVQAIASDRRSVRSMVKHLSQQQRLLGIKYAAATAPTAPAADVFMEPTINVVKALDLHSTHVAAESSAQCLYADVRALVDVAVADLRVQASGLILNGKKIPRIELQAIESSSIPVRVRVDRADFSLVLSSMLKRSLLSLNGENGLIRISSRIGLHGVSIVIEDNGWGFREKFLQLKSSEKASAQAQEVGLSLTEAQKLMEFWGGRLEILSRLGVGSRVTLELERTDAYASAPVATPVTKPVTNHEGAITVELSGVPSI